MPAPPTPIFGLARYDENDTGELDVLINGLSNTLELALKANVAVPVASQAQRGTIFPSPVQGNKVYRLDRGWEETYFAAYNASTNPGGATPAGWYPTGGMMPTLIGTSKGSTGVSNDSFTNMNTSPSQGTNHRNDGFTYGAGAISVPYPGLYNISARVTYPSVAGGARGIGFSGNGSGGSIDSVTRANWAAGGTPFAGSAIVDCVSSFSVRAYQGSGSTMSVDLNEVTAVYLGPRRA